MTFISRLAVRLWCATAVAAFAASTAFAAANSDAPRGPGQDTSSAIVQLNAEPLATYSRTQPTQGRKIDFNSNTVKSYRAQLSAMRNDYKAWLRANAPQAKVTGEFDISLNAVAVQLNGATLAQISGSPLVRTAQYQNLYYPNATNDPDLSLINAQTAWSTGGGAANAGRGVRVAIVDTGIDITHPCFSDAGYPSQQQLGDHSFTNNKVIVAKVFNNKTPSRRYTAEPVQSHGTHVAGTVACNLDTPAIVDGVVIPYAMSGVAPAALLGNYNIFPGEVDSARSEDILDALEAAYADDFDVANMSLGGGARGIQDLLTIAVDNLDKANMVVAVAAGNSGPGFGTVESPGSAARALTAGASSVGHYIGTPITVNGSTYGASSGDFATVTADLTAPLAVLTAATPSGLSDACAAIATNLTGKIALLTRGACAFSQKIRNAQAAGAAAVVVANNTGGDPIAMGTDGTPNQPTIPAYMVSQLDGQAIKTADGATTTIGATLAYISTPNSNIMADFSSQGPTDVDYRVKPDVVAPGVNVLSSIPANACAAPPCFAFFQGTSMATPHLAGSAAFLRGMHPTWSAAEVRSAVVNTAARGLLQKSNVTGLETNMNITGAGLEDLASAATATAVLSPVSVSFGAVPSGSGQASTADVTIRNVGGAAATWSLSVTGGDASVGYTVSPSSVTLGPGASTTVQVTMNAARGASFGGHQATLEVGSAAHAVLFTIIK